MDLIENNGALKAEKEDAIDFVSDCYAKDIISIEVFERKIESIHLAKNMKELNEIIQDLPNNKEDNRHKISLKESLTFNTENRIIDSSILLTEKLCIKSKLGTIEIDYTKLRVPSGFYEIEISGKINNIKIRLPRYSKIENTLKMKHSQVLLDNDFSQSDVIYTKTFRLSGDIEKTEIRISN